MTAVYVQCTSKARESKNKTTRPVLRVWIVLNKLGRKHRFTKFLHTNPPNDALVRCVLREFKLPFLDLCSDPLNDVRPAISHFATHRLRTLPTRR